MAFAFKTQKSGGIRITSSVHQLIKMGNAARDMGRWEDAAAAFKQALALTPELHHIHLQYGHALKEAGRLSEAGDAYAEAIRSRPDDVEPLMHRLHLAVRTNGPRAAARLLVAALAQNPGHDILAAEFIGPLDPALALSPVMLRQALKEGSVAEALASPRPEATVDRVARRVFDITDLIGHFRHQRLPNGIERVQIEILQKALDQYGDGAIGICCFIGKRDAWVGVPPTLFRSMAALATIGSDPEDGDWRLARTRLFLHLALADDYAIPPGAVLINLGTSWWIHDYFRHIRNAKTSSGIRYIPLIYDLIPVLAPQYCLPDITRDYVSWIIGALRHADGFLAISEYSRGDLLDISERLGLPLTADRVEVVPLDAEFRRAVAPVAADQLATWALKGTQFALMVSTIEPRKNHSLAFDAWSDLLQRFGPDRVPRLVCVGRDGWLNDSVFARLKLDPLLAAHVTLIHRASDEELALLYRSCSFTVYPSLYEGWGLPVTESLSYGRVAIVADGSSLPEAGGGFAVMFASGSLDALVAAVEQVAFDDRWRETREAEIAARFAPRPWAQVAEHVDRAVSRLLETAAPATIVPIVAHGRYYPTILHHGIFLPTRPTADEDVRVGQGWLWPDQDGCRTGPDGGEVRLHVTGMEVLRLRLHLRLRGLETADCPVSIVAGGEEIARAVIPAGKIRWLACDVTGPDVAFLLRGAVTEAVEMRNGRRIASVSLLGLLPTDRDIAPDALLAAIDRASAAIVLGGQ